MEKRKHDTVDENSLLSHEKNKIFYLTIMRDKRNKRIMLMHQYMKLYANIVMSLLPQP